MIESSKIKIFPITRTSKYWRQVIELAILCDTDFYPPLSHRMPIVNFFEQFDNENAFVIVVTNNELLVGSACGFYFHKDYNVAYFQFILFHENFRNLVLSRKLVNFVFNSCKERGVYFIQARTWSTNLASRKLMKDTGFYQIKAIPNDRYLDIHTYEYEKCLFENESFKNIKRLGILGGMGGLASAKFLLDIYSLIGQTAKENKQLPIILNSETNTPNRSELIINNQIELLSKYLEKQLGDLKKQKVSHIVICCFSYHSVLNYIGPNLRKRVVSLVDFTNQILKNKIGKFLLLSTNGFSKLHLLKSEEIIIYPKFSDQEQIQNLIYRLKTGDPHEIVLLDLIKIVTTYNINGIILGCTDLYPLGNTLEKAFSNFEIINPLKVMAHNISENWKISIKNTF